MQPRERLTAKELQVALLVWQGLTNREIALAIGTTEQVVKNYLRNTFDKLGVWSRLELALYVASHGGLKWSEEFGLRKGAVDGRHVIEALKIICARMRLTLKAGECRYRESFVIFLIAQKLGRVSPHSMLSTQEATPRATILVVDDSPDMLRYLRMVL